MIRPLLTLLAALLLLGGCAGKKLETRQDEHFDFSRLKTVAIVHPHIDDPRTTSAQKIFDKYFAQALREKGYTVVTDRKKADFILTYHLGATDTRQLSNDYRLIGIYHYNYGYGYGYPGYAGGGTVSTAVVGPSNQSYEFSEGKIIVEAIDPRDETIFWGARMTDRLKGFKSPAERERYIAEVVEKTLRSFPKASR
ncbi:DUF4136 domain-containing protein [Hydrogenimonas sp.]